MPSVKAKNAVKLEITQLLHQDHVKVKELFFQFHEAEDESKKESLCKEILTELFIHSTVEEEVVYPVVQRKAEEGEELVDEAETEHRVVKFLMAELSKMEASDEKFDAKVTVLCELVSHHIAEEEKEMFKKLRDSGANLEKLGQEAQAKKEELMGQDFPAMEALLSIGGEEVTEAKKPQPKKKVPSIQAKAVAKKRKTA